MDGISRPASSGLPVEIDGETVILDPFRLEDFGVMENHMRAKLPNLIKLAAEAAVDIPEPLASKIIDKAFAESRKIHSIPPDEVLANMQTIDGFSLAIWICIDRRNPGKFTAERIRSFITNLAASDRVRLNELMRGWQMISGLSDEGNSTGRQTPEAAEIKAASLPAGNAA